MLYLVKLFFLKVYHSVNVVIKNLRLWLSDLRSHSDSMTYHSVSRASLTRSSSVYPPSKPLYRASGAEDRLEETYPFTYQEITDLIQPASMSLCMIDKNLCLSSEDTRVVYALFGGAARSKQVFEKHSFLNIIDPYLMASKKKQVRQYLRYLFTNVVDAGLIQKRNPLRCFTITALNKGNGSTTKHYEFNFKPLVRNGIVEKILISIEDISYAMAMEYSISSLREKDQRSSEKLSSIASMLQFEKEIIIEFLLSTSAAFKEVRGLVQAKNASMDERNKKLNEIFRIAHQIKGDAAALGFKFLAQESHNFESTLDQLKFRGVSQANKNDLVLLVEPLKKMIASLVNIRSLMDHLTESEWSQESGREAQNEELSIIKKLSSLTGKIAAESKKTIKIIDNFSHVRIPDRIRADIEDILVQLSRNAMVHGIEKPAIRKQQFKTDYGCLHICASKTDGVLHLDVRDDGAGINIEKIRASALASGKYKAQQIAGWKAEDIFLLMKSPGFSTASSLSSHAGRGVGLDLIDSKVKKLGGTMSMSSKKGLYTQFTLTFPI